jgi:hypothetical protein
MRPRNFRWLARFSTVVCATLALASVSACSSEEQSVQAGAKTVEGNVEESGRIMKETWDEDRAQGDGVVESAGNAYEGVLEEGREKAGGGY